MPDVTLIDNRSNSLKCNFERVVLKWHVKQVFERLSEPFLKIS